MWKFTDADEAIRWVMSRHSRHQPFSHYVQAMAEAGNPQDDLKVIHVAGTNGKGSVSHNLACMFTELGKKTGLFVSPHLENHRDRIRIDDAWIPAEVFLQLLNERLELIEKYDLPMFQIDFLLACDWYRASGVDLAVIECGMGGLRDATNVLHHTECSVITSISYDHMQYLGSTLEEIAAQKAGILKPQTPVVLGNLPDCAVLVTASKAVQTSSRLYLYEPYQDLGPARMCWRGQEYRLASYARYQKHNAAVSLKVMQALGYDWKDPRIVHSLACHSWPGRFEKVAEKPLVILDGAHNPEGMLALTESLDQLPHPRIAVFSALKDKQGPQMRDMLEKKVDTLLITAIDYAARAADPDRLAGQGQQVIEDWRQAVDTAISLAGETGSVIVCGSLYLISDVRAYLKQKTAGR